MSENKVNKLVVDDIEVIVSTRDITRKPYFEIKYREVGRDDYNIGFGSYDLKNVLKWKEEEFVIVSDTRKETKQVTNEELLEQLRVIEISQSNILVNQCSVMKVILMLNKRDELRLGEREVKTLQHGIETSEQTIEVLFEETGLKEMVKQTKEEFVKQILEDDSVLGEILKFFK